MKILVIGGLGCVGLPLVKELRHRGNEVWVADKAHNHDPQYIRCDISKYQQVEKLFKHDFDYVYNLGADNYNTVLETANQIAKYFGVEVKNLPEKTEGFTLPFMKNNKLIAASNIKFSANQVSNLNTYLDQLNNSLNNKF